MVNEDYIATLKLFETEELLMLYTKEKTWPMLANPEFIFTFLSNTSFFFMVDEDMIQ